MAPGGLSGWLGRIFFEKKGCLDGWGAYFSRKRARLDGWGAYFSRKRLVWMAGARISRERGLSGWLGRVFLKKKACLDGWGAYFSRKRLAWMAGAYFSRKRLASMAGVRISREKGLVLRVEGPLGNPGNQSRIFIHGFRLQFLRKSCHFGQLVWALQDPPRRVSREISPSRPSLSGYLRFLREIRKVYLRTPVFFEKYAKFICVPLFPRENWPSLSAYPCFSREKGLSG